MQDDKLLGILRELEKEGEQYKEKEISKDWETLYKFYKGEHWKRQDPNDPRPVTNFCFSSTRSSVALLTDNQPRLDALPVDRDDTVGADIVKRILWAMWRRDRMPDVIDVASTDSHIFGTAVFKTIFDKDITTFCVPPEYFYVSPDATFNSQPAYFFQKTPMSVGAIQRVYGKKVKAEQTLTASGILRRINNSPEEDKTTFTVEEGTDKSKATTYVGGDSAQVDPLEDRAMAWVTEFYLYKPEKNDYEITTYSGDTILETGKMLSKIAGRDIKGNAHNPFTPLYVYMDSNSFWGTSEIGLYCDKNRDYNLLSYVIGKHIRKVGNTMIVTDSNSGVVIEKIVDEEGLIVTVNPGTRFERMAPPPMPSEAFNLLDRIKNEIDTITGIHDVTQGRRPTGITAGVAIGELQEAAQVPIRRKARALQSALNAIGIKSLALAQIHYGKDRMKKITEDMTPAHQQYDIKKLSEYDIYFDVESSLGETRTSKLTRATNLFSMGLYDKRAVLEAIDEPDREPILKRMAMTDAMNKMLATGMIPQDLSNVSTMPPEGMGGESEPVTDKSNVSAPIGRGVLESAPIGG